MILGDFNAKHQQWFDIRPSDNYKSLARGKSLAKWSKERNTVERGPREANRHREGQIPSKIDLMWTTRHRTNFMCCGYYPNSRSDHQIISTRLRLIRNPRITTQPRPDYKKMNPTTIQHYFETHPPPTDSNSLDSYLQGALQLIPSNSRHPVHRLPPDLLNMRRSLCHQMKSRWNNDDYRTLRYQYRDALANHINARIEDTLESSQHPEFFQFSKRGSPSKPVPTLSYQGRKYSGHKQIARCLAEYHGAGPRIKLRPIPNPNIPRVSTTEVTECLAKAPPTSANGPDSISAKLLDLLQASHSTCLSTIHTDILRSGHHPRSWKTATIIPIPKANKPTYTTPKSWRSIHLLNVVSKTLERIVLSRLQSPTQPFEPMSPSQFGSRTHRGTSDAMQALLQWQKTARSRNHYVTLIATDIEGGFDKVHPARLPLTDIDPMYIPWIQHWASDREIKYHHGNRLDLHTYYTNRGVPQGSPLSPFLFGAYIKETTRPCLSSSQDSSSLVISYVDDVLICISARTPHDVENMARSIWSDLNLDAQNIGMSFAENKTVTKTWHDRPETWGTGTIHPKLRFFGYWLETPSPNSRLLPPTFGHHLDYWSTKANYMLNVLRALSLCSSRGLKMPAILQIFEACCKSMLHYGIEFWGDDPKLIQKADSFIYAAMRVLFDLPTATPHRAISSEFHMVPSSIQYNLIIRRIATRRLHYKPLSFLDDYFPPGNFSQKILSSIDKEYFDFFQSLPPPYKVEWPDNVDTVDFTQKLDFSLLRDNDLFVFSDGSYKDDIASIGFVVFSGLSWKRGISLFKNHGRLTPRNSILDAEIHAMLAGLEYSLTQDLPGDIYLLSDSQSALQILSPWVCSGLYHPTQKALRLVKSTLKKIKPTWIKGHGTNIGNITADILAKTATTTTDLHPHPSLSHLHLRIRKQSALEWLEWFQKNPHYYTRKPTSNRKHYKGHSRLDTTTLFKLRSNKGWHPTDPIGTKPSPPCSCDHTSPRDGHHILSECPIYSAMRSPFITEQIHLNTYAPAVMKWIRHHKHFGMKPQVSPVRWINLSNPGNLASVPKSVQCPVCQLKLSCRQSLWRHKKNTHPNGTTTIRAWDPTHTCPSCTQTHLNKQELDNHIASVHGCPDCPYRCGTGPNLKKYMISVHGSIPCPGCTHRFPNKWALRQHQRSNCRGSRS